MAHIISHLYILLAQMCTWEQGFANPQTTCLCGCLFLNTQVLLLKSILPFMFERSEPCVFFKWCSHTIRWLIIMVSLAHGGPWWPMVGPWWPVRAAVLPPPRGFRSWSTSRWPPQPIGVACNHKWVTNETSKKGRHLLVSTKLNIYLNIAKINDTK